MVDARESFARSSNLAILWRLRGIPRARLLKAAVDFGLKLPGDVDPAYALAYTGVADAYINLGGWGYLPFHEAYTRGKAAATRALEIPFSFL